MERKNAVIDRAVPLTFYNVDGRRGTTTTTTTRGTLG
jgi:hypothetical protein